MLLHTDPSNGWDFCQCEICGREFLASDNLDVCYDCLPIEAAIAELFTSTENQVFWLEEGF